MLLQTATVVCTPVELKKVRKEKLADLRSSLADSYGWLPPDDYVASYYLSHAIPKEDATTFTVPIAPLFNTFLAYPVYDRSNEGVVVSGCGYAVVLSAAENRMLADQVAKAYDALVANVPSGKTLKFTFEDVNTAVSDLGPKTFAEGCDKVNHGAGCVKAILSLFAPTDCTAGVHPLCCTLYFNTEWPGVVTEEGIPASSIVWKDGKAVNGFFTNFTEFTLSEWKSKGCEPTFEYKDATLPQVSYNSGKLGVIKKSQRFMFAVDAEGGWALTTDAATVGVGMTYFPVKKSQSSVDELVLSTTPFDASTLTADSLLGSPTFEAAGMMAAPPAEPSSPDEPLSPNEEESSSFSVGSLSYWIPVIVSAALLFFVLLLLLLLYFLQARPLKKRVDRARAKAFRRRSRRASQRSRRTASGKNLSRGGSFRSHNSNLSHLSSVAPVHREEWEAMQNDDVFLAPADGVRVYGSRRRMTAEDNQRRDTLFQSVPFANYDAGLLQAPPLAHIPDVEMTELE